MSQIGLLPGIDPDELIAEAKAEHLPVATICLFSGGHDSTVLAHRCRDHYDELAFIDTTTAVPGVREFVEVFADWIGKPLRILEHPRNAYRDLVLGTKPGSASPPLGFPGPAQHNRAYNQLKERALRRLTATCKSGSPRSARVLYLSGVRRGESARRRTRQPITRDGGAVFANPLIDWTNDDMRAYRTAHKLPESDVAALLHRSGECNCGAFAAPGEREQLASLWPEWFEQTIAALEHEAAALGIPACRWGERPADRVPDAGPLCSDCQLRIDDAQEAA